MNKYYPQKWGTFHKATPKPPFNDKSSKYAGKAGGEWSLRRLAIMVVEFFWVLHPQFNVAAIPTNICRQFPVKRVGEDQSLGVAIDDDLDIAGVLSVGKHSGSWNDLG